MSGLLSGLMGAIKLSMDKSVYQVGEKPLYRLTGGVPGATIAWTSYLNGQPTGEYQATYGQWLDNYGAAEIPAAQAWNDTHVGSWRKDVIIIPNDYPKRPLENATVSFQVAPIPDRMPQAYENNGSGSAGGSGAAGADSGGLLDSITNIFEGDVTLPVVGEVPKAALVGLGAVVLIVALSGSSDSGGGRRR
ncbi:MAG: hypothetical protein BWY07_01987 [Candidatus Hydrogenedentes bacterium ADurb.Bin170]|nr:MAG: hypothetical protein BWY07_01987 [Candidatus Hydrogenedentes bacterium ADurb.Bin170]